MKNSLLLTMVLVLLACTDSALEKKLVTTQQELEDAQSTIAQLQSQVDSEGDWVHMVFFKLQPNTNQEELIKEIKKLKNIPLVKNLRLGSFENTGDQRALSEYDLVLEL